MMDLVYDLVYLVLCSHDEMRHRDIPDCPSRIVHIGDVQHRICCDDSCTPSRPHQERHCQLLIVAVRASRLALST